MKADEPDTDILETLRKLVKRVEILEIDNRQLKKENEQLRQENTQLRQENTQLRQENTRLKKRIEELERKNKRYVAPHSRELAKKIPNLRVDVRARTGPRGVPLCPRRGNFQLQTKP